MKQHVINYLEALGFDGYSFMPCELCGASGIEIHHVEPRSKFGSKMKHLQDHVSNLVCLCRICHDKAHNSEDTRIIKDQLKDIIKSRNPNKS